MKDHLSEQQLSEWILGEAGTEAGQHLDACSTCRREAEQLKEALGAFREVIHTSAGTYRSPWRAPAPTERAGWAGFVTHRWAYAAALATILLVSVALLRFEHRTARPAAEAAAENQILMEVQNDVSETVPGALEPGELLLAGVPDLPAPPTAKVAGKAGKSSRR